VGEKGVMMLMMMRGQRSKPSEPHKAASTKAQSVLRKCAWTLSLCCHC